MKSSGYLIQALAFQLHELQSVRYRRLPVNKMLNPLTLTIGDTEQKSGVSFAVCKMSRRSRLPTTGDVRPRFESRSRRPLRARPYFPPMVFLVSGEKEERAREEEFSRVANSLLKMIGGSIDELRREDQKVAIAIGLANFVAKNGPPSLDGSFQDFHERKVCVFFFGQSCCIPI